ncbi:Uncharacterized protein PCOAH_00051030 [Plasmodium coatneyi]|uniref:Uncharacterized protein n=1 Tax=Plasmodium coatneyi TaxID=208452 RepID=A0A1B1E6R4_9APIC|nr:Uncharacterized protein PCOAH_00051030 [Plasmodium coatneyi]ANQ10722.1 Uncharacterized protein PCOAH_00051030 [Plasmodium coatneyi]
MLNLKVAFFLSVCILLFPLYSAKRDAQSNEDTPGASSHLYMSLEGKQINPRVWENGQTGRLFGGSANKVNDNNEGKPQFSLLFCASKGVSCEGNNLPSQNRCTFREYQNANRCSSAHDRMIQLKDVCPYRSSDGNSSPFLHTNGGTMKQTSKGGKHKFDHLLLHLRNIIPSEMTQKKEMTQRRHKNCMTIRDSVKNKSVYKFLEDESMKRNVGTYHTWYEEETARLFSYQEEVKRMMSVVRKSRILVEACTLDCGNNGTCEMNSGLQYCHCKQGYSMDIKDNFMCKEHCAVNNGGCDPNATCTPVKPEDEKEKGVIKNVGVLCTCKNGNTKHMGYYCN